MDILLSIIIPIYNVENYITECLDSICNQYKTGIELLLINDGSTDSSGIICDQYAQSHPYIRVIHQKNAGPSAARNAGIRNAIGKYITFVDSDDFIAGGSLKHILTNLKHEEFDLYFLNTKKFYPDGHSELQDLFQKEFFSSHEKWTIFHEISKMKKFPGGAWSKIAKRSLIESNNIYFKEGILSEDIHWLFHALLYADSISYLEGDYYFYRQNRNDSLTNKVSLKRLEDWIWVIEDNIQSGQSYSSEIKKDIYSMMSYELEVLVLLYGLYLLQNSKQQVSDEVLSFQKRFENSLWLLKYRRHIRTQIFRIGIHFIGIRNFSKLIARIYQK